MSIRSVINSRHDYRADIDGLRAIAILLVIGFHYFPSLVSGGFVGVDIFFVISGFLISKHILTDLNTKSFSYKKFYARRIKRIFPALSVILIFCIIAGWVILTPAEYELLGKHIAAGAGFVSNIFYWKDAGYFDTAADTKPLLHLWSLGIEEQFYILWPLLLVLFRKTKQLSWCLLAVLVISLFYNIFLVQHNVVADFYSPLTRFWEFVVGAGITRLVLPKSISKINRSFISWIGLGLILIAVMMLNKNSLFPGAWALLPTLGAACLIYAGEKAWLNRFILSSRLMVWIGLISYPLYLWHWPLLSMMRIMDGQMPSTETKLILIVISVLLYSRT